MTAPRLTPEDLGRDFATLLERIGPGPVPVPTGGRSSLHDRLLSLDDLRGPVPPTAPYVLEGLVREGDLVALVSAPKAGKSLLALDLVGRAVAAGRTVVYLDAENGFRDVHARVHALGHGTAALTGLHYCSFPQLALDTPNDAAELTRFVAELFGGTGRPDLVVLDTASRFLSGDENDASPWLAMYRLALLGLKQQGAAVLRLDHLGKDASKGARGSSAKSGDVDAVFELTADPSGNLDQGRRLSLECTMQRSGTYPSQTVLVRSEVDGVLGHRPPGTNGVVEPGNLVSDIVAALDAAGAAPGMGRDRARELVGAQFPDASKRVWEQVVRQRKLPTLPDHFGLSAAAANWTVPTTPFGPAREHS